MRLVLLWIGDQFARGMADDWDCDSIFYRVSEWFYRLAWSE